MSFDSDWGSTSTTTWNNNPSSNNNNPFGPASAVSNPPASGGLYPSTTGNNNSPATTATPAPANTKNLENEIFSECHSQITKNIQQLTNLFDEIKGNLHSLGKRADTKMFRETMNERIALAQKLLKDTQVTLRKLDGIASNSQRTKEKKQKVAKLTQDFESKLYNPFQQLITQARKLMDEIPIPVTSVLNNDGYGESNPLLQGDYQQYFKIADETAFQDGIIHEREREIAGIQRQVVEVNEIFRDIGRMIAEQAPAVENIQSHISEVVGNVKAADEEVHEADSLHRSSRKKLCFIVLGVVIVAAICVIVVVIVLTARVQL
jgi:t-SNARE complex subunit (syntaxin)